MDRREENRIRYLNDKEDGKTWYQRNRAKVLAKAKKKFKTQAAKDKAKEYYQQNKAKIIAYQREWRRLRREAKRGEA